MNDSLVKLREGTSVAAQLTVKNYNALVDAVRRNWIRPGPNTLMNQDSGGTQLWQKPSTGGKRALPEPKTFFVTSADTATATKVNVTAGAINSEIYDGTFDPPGFNAPYVVADGYSVWIEVDWDTDGVTVTSIDVHVGATMPTGDAVTSYKLLATVAVAAGVTTVTPLGWNFTDAQACGKDGDGAIVVNYN